jgi:hypothetical protein
MLKIKHTKSVRKEWRCDFCADPIKVGMPCKQLEPFRAPKIRRHETCPDWKMSERESNEAASNVWAALEALEATTEVWRSEVQDTTDANYPDAIRECANEIREAATLRTESADSLEEGFGHSTDQTEELRAKADEYEAWADELETVADTIEAAVHPVDGEIPDDVEDWDAFYDGLIEEVNTVIQAIDP